MPCDALSLVETSLAEVVRGENKNIVKGLIALSGNSLFGVLGVITFYRSTTKIKFIWKFKND